MKGRDVETEADLLARELIEVFAAALRDLNDGKPVPKPWRDHLERAIGPKVRRGRPPLDKVTKRDIKIARRMLQHKLAIDAGSTTMRITAFAQQLADEYRPKGRAFEAKDIFHIYRRYQIEVWSDEVWRRLKAEDEAEQQARLERARRIRERLANGETLNEILSDPFLSYADFKAIRNHQTKGTDLAGTQKPASATDYATRRQKIMRWISDGMGLGIYEPVPIANLRVARERDLIPAKRRHR